MEERKRCEICNRDFESQEALNSHNADKHGIYNRTSVTTEQKSKKFKWFFLIAIALGILIVGYFSLGKSTTGNVISKDIQRITLSFKSNYYPNTITVKQGVPVEITLDNSVRGCYRSFNIKALGVSGYSTNPSQTIAFTPNKKGTFEFACSMRMGYGKIIVE